jgi:hypothetical protein
MFMYHHQNAGETHKLTVTNKSVEKGESIKIVWKDTKHPNCIRE